MIWKQVPTICQFDITGKCNLRCRHCRAALVRKTKHDLPFDLVTNILTQVIQLTPACAQVLAGGEPLMRHDLRAILEFVRRLVPDARIEILTNGTLINRQNVSWLVDLVSGFNLSLEGSCAATNDNIRGSGSFKQAMAGLETLMAHQTEVCVRLTYCNQNEDEVVKLMMLLPEIGVGQFNIRYVVPVGCATQTEVSSIQYRRLAEIVSTVGRELGLIVGYSDPFPEILLNSDQRRKIIKNPGLKSGRLVTGCSMGYNLLYLDPAGMVRGCPYYPSWCGDATQEPIEKIWFCSKELDCLRMLRVVLDKKSKCGQCRYRFACGGCRGAAWANGNVFGEDPRCWYNS